MRPEHETIEELLAARALGGLETDEERELDRLLAEHGDCEACRRLAREAAETAAALALTLEPVAPPAGIIERILAAEPPTTAAEPADELTRRRAARSAQPPRRSSRPWWSVGAVAAALVALVVSLSVAMPGTQEIRSVNLAQRVVRFEGDAGVLAMAIFWGHGLPDLPAGQVLEIWMIDDDRPTSGGCAVPVDGRLALAVDASIGTTDQMAVTVEDASCPDAPTSEPVLVAPL
jgi:anti-sigma-K factor RskA